MYLGCKQKAGDLGDNGDMIPSKLRLYHYWRSTSSWRVRWALAHKGIACEYVAVNLLDDETDRSEHRARNPMGYVPVLEADGKLLTESVAMLEWIEELWPEPRLLPQDPWLKARVRALVETINAGTQPVQNLSVLEKLSDDPAARKAWAQHWIRQGLASFEALARDISGKHCVGGSLTFADLALVPQCYNAGRQEIDVAREFPRIQAWVDAALATPSGQASHPDRFKP